MTTFRATERTALQSAILIAATLPVVAGLQGMLGGIPREAAETLIDLDNHYSFLSGLLFAIGCGFWSCVAGIEAKTDRMRTLTALVVVGGIGRIISLDTAGGPSMMLNVALAMEMIVAPLLCVWQARVARLYSKEKKA